MPDSDRVMPVMVMDAPVDRRQGGQGSLPPIFRAPALERPALLKAGSVGGPVLTTYPVWLLP